MNCSRRRLLKLSGSLLLLSSGVTEAAGESQVVIKMQGTPRGERVWFDPKGIAVDPGTTITFVNQDPGNSHTVTAYHPEYFDRVRRMPKVPCCFILICMRWIFVSFLDAGISFTFPVYICSDSSRVP